MSDRELLELAARAAGVPKEVVGAAAGSHWIESNRSMHLQWNPLTDDGDTLRMLVAVPEACGLEWLIVQAWQACDTPADRAAYVRRKATEKVAEIGKLMETGR